MCKVGDGAGRRRRSRIGWAALFLATAMGSHDVGAGDDPNPVEVPWPALKPGATAVFRASMTLSLALEKGHRTELGLTVEFAAEALAAQTNGLRDVRVTQGRVWGRERNPATGAPFGRRVVQSTEEVGMAMAFAFPGASGVLRLGQTAAQAEETRSLHPDVGDYAYAFLAPPLAATVRVGSSWASHEGVEVRDRVWAMTWNNVVEGVDGSAIRVRSEPAREAWIDEGAVAARVDRRLSRDDGLMIDGSFMSSVGRGDINERMEVRFERVPAVAPPPEALAAERALKDLAGGNAPERAAAAAALAANWPYGARAAPVLVAALADDDARVREAAARAIEALGRQAIGVAVEFATHLSAAEPSGYASVLSACEALGGALTSQNLAWDVVGVPLEGALAVGLLATYRTTSNSGRAYAPFLPLLDRATARFAAGMEIWDRSAREMAAAAVALLALEALPVSPTREIPPGVLDLLKDADVVKRWTGARLLHLLGGARPEVVAALGAAPPDPEKAAIHAWEAVAAATAHLTAKPVVAPVPKPAEAPTEERVAALIAALGPPKDPRREAMVPFEEYEAAIETLEATFDRMAPALRDRTIAALLAEVPMGRSAAHDASILAFAGAHGGLSPAAAPALVGVFETSRDRLAVLLATGAVEEWQDGAQRLRAVGDEWERPWSARYAVLSALARIGPPAAAALPLLDSLASSDDALLRTLAGLAARRIRAR